MKTRLAWLGFGVTMIALSAPPLYAAYVYGCCLADRSIL